MKGTAAWELERLPLRCPSRGTGGCLVWVEVRKLDTTCLCFVSLRSFSCYTAEHRLLEIPSWVAVCRTPTMMGGISKAPAAGQNCAKTQKNEWLHRRDPTKQKRPRHSVLARANSPSPLLGNFEQASFYLSKLQQFFHETGQNYLLLNFT